MSGDFKATPFARLFFCIFLKGFSKEIDHLSLVGFFNSRTFQARFGVWTVITASRSKSLEGFRKGFRGFN